MPPLHSATLGRNLCFPAAFLRDMGVTHVQRPSHTYSLQHNTLGGKRVITDSGVQLRTCALRLYGMEGKTRNNESPCTH